MRVVRYAAQHGLRIAQQSTGHNAGPIEGLEDALLVRTDDLQELRHRPRGAPRPRRLWRSLGGRGRPRLWAAPEQYGAVLGQAEAVAEALAPWESRPRWLNFEEGKVNSRVFFDEDTWRLLQALRTEWDPKGRDTARAAG